MTDDIVTRLRAMVQWCENPKCEGCEVENEAIDEIERWRELAIHAWCHMGIDANCSDDDCEQCQAIKKAWENK